MGTEIMNYNYYCFNDMGGNMNKESGGRGIVYRLMVCDNPRYAQSWSWREWEKKNHEKADGWKEGRVKGQSYKVPGCLRLVSIFFIYFFLRCKCTFVRHAGLNCTRLGWTGLDWTGHPNQRIPRVHIADWPGPKCSEVNELYRSDLDIFFFSPKNKRVVWPFSSYWA